MMLRQRGNSVRIRSARTSGGPPTSLRPIAVQLRCRSGIASTRVTSRLTAATASATAVLFHDDVVRHRETKSSPFTGWFGREEWVEHLFLHLERDAGTVVANTNFDGGSEVLRGGPEGWLKTGFLILSLAPGRCINAVCNQIEKCAGDLLRE